MKWLFASPQGPRPPWKVVLWWELRRIPFNLIVGTYGFLCLMAYFWAIGTSGHLKPGEDALEPMALIAAPFGINILYTLGWIVEVPVRLVLPNLTPRFAPRLLKLGLGFGLFLITLPMAFWVGYRLLQMAGIVS